MTFATCRAGCNWQVWCTSDEEKERREAQHSVLRHGLTPTPLVQMAQADWEALALDAIRQYAARGDDFLIWEALQAAGVPDRPDAKSINGQLSMRVHRLGIAHPVAFDLSSRAGTRRSSVRKWNRDGSRCDDETCQRKAVLL